MTRLYKFNDASDMISLAQFIQTRVYWGSTFSIKDEDHVPYSQFWSYCESYMSEGFICVEIDDKDDEIRFYLV